jgi:hypothetical protein
VVCFAYDLDMSYLLLYKQVGQQLLLLLSTSSVFSSDPYFEYQYTDTGSGAIGYISSMNVFSFGPLNSLFQIARGSRATLTEALF